MTVWELESLCLQKLEDEQLSVQERNAWQNALNGARESIREIKKLHDDIFYGRVNMCDRCRKKDYNCTNADCLKEISRKYRVDGIKVESHQANEQMSLF